MQESNKNNIKIALKKATTLLQKVDRMIDDDQYCIDVLQQILAASGLLKSASSKIYKDHLNSCFKNAMNSKNEEMKEKMIGEILQIHKLTQK